ncbi:hypothetical protein SUGI_0191000 [Cryptomeria japonica]|nr:hypothetical protein SUGI_0191000 [Cryptomeria japonica]
MAVDNLAAVTWTCTIRRRPSVGRGKPKRVHYSSIGASSRESTTVSDTLFFDGQSKCSGKPKRVHYSFIGYSLSHSTGASPRESTTVPGTLFRVLCLLTGNRSAGASSRESTTLPGAREKEIEIRMVMAPVRSSSVSSPPYQLLFILVIVVLFLTGSWYMSYESVFEEVMEQVKLVLMLSPLLLLIMVHWLSVVEKPYIPLPPSEPNAIHRAGSSPWGMGLLVLLLLLMISYQSTFHEYWFPLWS